ncbi:MAG: hypothetical protein P1P69_08180, partial [Methanosarcinaceae archaeon]|nr:hypothetical protein [Methanosarcinaceae archaeon]
EVMEKVVQKELLEFKINKPIVVEAAKAVQKGRLEMMGQKAKLVEVVLKDHLEIKVNKALMAGIVKANKKAHIEDQDKTNDNVFGRSILLLQEGCQWMQPPTITFII